MAGKVPDFERLIDRGVEHLRHFDDNIPRRPVGKRPAHEREIVGKANNLTAGAHKEGILEHGPQAWGEYLKRAKALQEKYDRRAGVR